MEQKARINLVTQGALFKVGILMIECYIVIRERRNAEICLRNTCGRRSSDEDVKSVARAE